MARRERWKGCVGDGGRRVTRFGAGMEGKPFGGYQGRGDLYHCGDRRAGVGAAYLDDADGQLAMVDPAVLLGQGDDAFG